MSSFYPNEEEEKEVLRAITFNQLSNDTAEFAHLEEYTKEILEERLKYETFTCQTRTPSDVIDEQKINRIDLLKIDVQKSELDVLMGIRK